MPHRSTGGAAPVWLRRLRSSLIGGLLVVFLVGCVSRPAPPGGRAAQPDEPGKLPSPAVTASARVADIVNGMPLRTRIAQRFVIAVPRGFGVDGAVTREYIEMIMTDPPAGMILYPWNYTSRADVVRIIAKLQRAAAAAGSPPFSDRRRSGGRSGGGISLRRHSSPSVCGGSCPPQRSRVRGVRCVRPWGGVARDGGEHELRPRPGRDGTRGLLDYR
jgi:hypothetical protein